MLNNNNNNISQTANSNNNTYQAGRDNNINFINLSSDNIINTYIYEEDIKEIITCFSNISNTLDDNYFPDNKAIKIYKKNKLNKLSDSCFEDIKYKSLPQFNKIRKFLSNPRNSIYVDMYNNSATDFNTYILAIRSKYELFDPIFQLLYSKIIEKCKDDKNFLKKRTKVLLFLHFMYYNCDIGLKV